MTSKRKEILKRPKKNENNLKKIKMKTTLTKNEDDLKNNEEDLNKK
jgi:hypothetical protein